MFIYMYVCVYVCVCVCVYHKTCADTIKQLHEESAQCRSYLHMTHTSYQHNHTIISEQEAALHHAQVSSLSFCVRLSYAST